MPPLQKRLRRKTRVSQKSCEDLLMLSFHLWMPLLMTPAIQKKLHYRESNYMRTCYLYLLKRDEQKINEEISFYFGEPICIGFVPLFIMLVSLVCIPLFESCHTSIMVPNKHNPPVFRMSLL